jgi:hypothetical protein
MSSVVHDRDVPWDPVLRWSLIAGGVGCAVWVIGCVYAAVAGNSTLLVEAFFAYLFAWSFCLAIPLGSFPIWMVHIQTGGTWGTMIRRALEAAARVLPVNALLFIPLAFGLPQLYLWADPSATGDEHLRHLVHHRGWYLNAPFFLVRTAVYFAVWIGSTWLVSRWSAEVEATGDRVVARRMQVFSGPAIVAWGLALTLASVDWLMSLETEFFSTIFGMLLATGYMLPALAFANAVTARLHAYLPLAAEPLERDTWNDLGNLLLAAVMMWTYIAFSQLILVWSGNLPEEIVWYLKRSQGGWEWVGILLAVFYFAFPFAFLLSPTNKRDPRRLRGLAWALVAATVLYQFWLVKPVYTAWVSPEETYGPLSVHWLDAAAVIGLGGLTFAAFLWQLRSKPLLPPHNPLMEPEAAHA